MAIVKFYANGAADEPEVYTSITAGQFLVERWTTETVPERLRVFKGSICAENDITARIVNEGAAIAMDEHATYEIAVMPLGPAIVPVLIAAAVAVVAAVIITGNIDIPESGSTTNQSSSNQLGNRANKPRLGSRLPDIRGTEPNCVPDLWSNYRFFEDQVEFDLAYLCVSVGKGLPFNERDGQTDYSTVDGSSLEFYNPNTSPRQGSPFKTIGDPINKQLYVVRESNEVTGQSLIPPNNNVPTPPFSARDNGDIIQAAGNIDFTLFYVVGDTITLNEWYTFAPNSGGINFDRFDISGDYIVAAVNSNTVRVTIPPALQAGWNEVPHIFDTITETAWQSDLDPLEWQLTDPGVDWTEHNFAADIVDVSNIIIIGPYDVSNSNTCLINLIASSGIYKKSNNTTYFTINFKYTFRDLDSASTIVNTISLSSNKEEQSAQSYFLNTPYTNCTLEVERTSDRDYEFNGQVLDDVKWRDLYILSNPSLNQYGNVTTAFALTKATQSALKLKELQVNLQFTREAELGDATSIVSNLFADVIMSIHNDPYFGRGDLTTINRTNLYQVQQEIINYYGSDVFARVGYTFDSLKTRYEEALSLICDAVNVIYIPVGNQINFFFERTQAQSALQFGHRSKNLNNLNSEVISRSFKPYNEYDSIILRYKDETERLERTLYFPPDRSGFKPNEINFLGCTNERAALVKGWREYYKLIHGRIQHNFTSLEIGRLANRGLRVDVVDNTDFKGEGGYVVSQSGLRLTLSEPATFTGVNKSIGLTKADGSFQVIPVTEVVGDEYSVDLSQAPVEAIYTGWGRDKTEYTLMSDDERTKRAMIVREIEYEDIDEISIDCINYSDLYYQNDLLV